jgi:trigger factor
VEESRGDFPVRLEMMYRGFIKGEDMNVTRENITDGKVKLTIEVEAGKIALASDAVYAKLAPSVKVAGFRPGKAPKNIVEKEIGTERFESEILDIILPQTYYEAVVQEGIEVVGAPEVKLVKFVPTDGLTYEAVVEIMPGIKVPDLKKITVKKQKVTVTKAEIDEVLADMAKQLQKFEKVDRAAKMGDRVEIDFDGYLKGLPFDGGKSQNHPLVLGSKSFIPGFEEQLEGVKANDEKDVEVTFPKDYHSENLKGEKVTFKVKVHTVEEIILPEINDAFAKEVGTFADLATLTADIEKQLLFTKETQEKHRLEDEILTAIADKVKFSVPEGLIAQEQKRLMYEAENNLAQQGIQMTQYLEMIKKTAEEIEEEMKPEAEKRVKVGMILSQVAKDGHYQASEKELTDTIKDRLKNVPEAQSEEAKKYYESHDGKHQLANGIVGTKVLDYLLETCSK